MLIQNRIWFALADADTLKGVLQDDKLQMARIMSVPSELKDNLLKAQGVVDYLVSNKEGLVANKGVEKYNTGFKEAMSQLTQADNAIRSWKENNWGTISEEVPVDASVISLSWQSSSIPSAEFLVRLSRRIHSDFDYFCAGDEIGASTMSYSVDSSQAFQVDVDNPFEFACLLWLVDYCDYIKKCKTATRGKLKYSDIAPCVVYDDSSVLLDSFLSIRGVIKT